MKRSIPLTETAALIRKALKADFPGFKFSVRSSRYAGGASIDVSWNDGPIPSAVEKIIEPFGGKGFDGSIDMAYYKQAWLTPDGRAHFAMTKGTEGQMGSRPFACASAPVPGAELVSFGADYVFAHRNLTDGFREHIKATWRGMSQDERAAWMDRTQAYQAAHGNISSWTYDDELSCFSHWAPNVWSALMRQTADKRIDA